MTPENVNDESTIRLIDAMIGLTNEINDLNFKTRVRASDGLVREIKHILDRAGSLVQRSRGDWDDPAMAETRDELLLTIGALIYVYEYNLQLPRKRGDVDVVYTPDGKFH